MIKAIKTILNGLVSFMRTNRPNWAQNDPEALDYIKNRPFYSEPKNVTVENVVEEEELELNHFPVFAIGDTVTVNVDGVKHSLVAYDDDGYPTIGDTTSSINSGEGQLGWQIYVAEDGVVWLYAKEAHTVSYLCIAHHKLDKKYMPDEVLDDIYNAKTAANDAQTTANNAEIKANNAQTTVNSKMNASNPVGTGSFSMGRKSGTAIGGSSHAEGQITTASGVASHAEGQSTKASGVASHAEGYKTTASGSASHAEGENTTASGVASHAEGNETTASGYYSHAEGQRTTASGISSHAEGQSTKASGSDQHVQGKYNVEDSQNKYAHIVGNGTDYNNRSNAHTLGWNGVAWFQGRPQFGGTAQDQDSQTVMANGDKEIILTSSTANSTKKFKITVDDSGTLTATEVTA